MIAAVVPFVLGMLVGNLNPHWREVVKPTAAIVIPFFAFALGANMNLAVFLQMDLLLAGVERVLAKRGHDGLVGINMLAKLKRYTLACAYGAMLAGVLGAHPSARGILFDQPQVVTAAGPVLGPAVEASAPLLLEAASACGLDAEVAVWDDESVDWSSYEPVAPAQPGVDSTLGHLVEIADERDAVITKSAADAVYAKCVQGVINTFASTPSNYPCTYQAC